VVVADPGRRRLVGIKMSKKVVDVKDVMKTYQMGEVQVHALRGLSMSVEKGEVVAIMGPSGSGKSTLMNILGCLDRPSSGTYILNGENVEEMEDDQLADVRNRQIGFIFQSYNLLSSSTAVSNVMLPIRYRRNNGHGDPAELAKNLLTRVGLEDRINHKPFEMSGGQQQRVAIARALVNDPAIILADEPTGNLDSKSGDEIMELLLGLNKERGVTLIIVTHDPKIGEMTNRTIRIFDGRIQDE
jgi:putative ABC transport system ATP-binding protein